MIYQIKSIHEEFKTLSLDPDDLFNQVPDPDDVYKILKQPGTNDSLLSVWKNISSSMRDVYDNNPAKPDVSIWLFVYLLVNQKAYNALKDHLKESGEFLPLMVDGEQMYIFNCLEYGKEDKDLCLTDYIDGIACGLKSLAFDEDDTKDKVLFKSKMQGGNRLFGSDKFKQLCDDNDLRGLRYDEDLVGVF